MTEKKITATFWIVVGFVIIFCVLNYFLVLSYGKLILGKDYLEICLGELLRYFLD